MNLPTNTYFYEINATILIDCDSIVVVTSEINFQNGIVAHVMFCQHRRLFEWIEFYNRNVAVICSERNQRRLRMRAHAFDAHHDKSMELRRAKNNKIKFHWNRMSGDRYLDGLTISPDFVFMIKISSKFVITAK